MHFSNKIINWQIKFGRHDLPWQLHPEPYYILISEVMLQQTQVAVVIPFFKKFIQRFPSIIILAQANIDEILSLWAGLGYYRRAHNLHHLAQIVASKYAGHIPSDIKTLMTLPGIGRSTAAAISCFAFNKREPILDGNVKRIFCRVFSISGQITQKSTENILWRLAENSMPAATLSAKIYIQGLMDLGSSICKTTNPVCMRCPVNDICQANLSKSQHLFPEKKKKKSLPTKEKTMLLLHDSSTLILQKKPKIGVWAGLWSLPEINPDSKEYLDLDILLKAHSEKMTYYLPTMLHSFSHFYLQIKTIAINYEYNPFNMKFNASYKKISWHEITQYGLPAPIKRIIEIFHQNKIIKH